MFSIPDCHGAYPLHYAVQMCANESKKQAAFLKCLERLIAYGADIKALVS